MRKLLSNHPLSFWILLLVFGILYALISLVNHYNFRTYAFDLGIFNNSLYDYAHFQWDKCTVMEPGFNNVLSDHFNLIPILISPLYWLTGSYTFLILQIAGILWGAAGMYLLVYNHVKKEWAGLLAMVHFMTMWGVFSALAYDYHDNVMAAMFMPWFFLAIQTNRIRYAALWFSLILISKENMAFWMIFVCIGMMLIYRHDRNKMKKLAVFSGSALLYFLLVMMVIMPALADPGKPYQHFDYQALGNSFGEAFKHLVTQPFHSISLLFTNHLPDSLYNGIKGELWLAVLLSGGLALLLRPAFFIMLIPIFAQKLFSDHFEYWGINNHYSIEFVPVITYAVYWFIQGIQNQRVQKYLAVLILLISIGASFSFLDHRVSKHYKRANHRFYQRTHYQRNFDVQEVHKFLKTIPISTKICAQNMLVPHLAFRETIYTFPVIKDADMIVLLPADSDTYPFAKVDYDRRITELLESGKWKKLDSPESMLVLTLKND